MMTQRHLPSLLNLCLIGVFSTPVVAHSAPQRGRPIDDVRKSPPVQATRSSTLKADTACTYGKGKCNVCVPNAVGQFKALKHHAEVLGFRRGDYRVPLSLEDHWQGMARIASNDGRRLVVSRDVPADLVTVFVASRDVGGRRFRSNRLARGRNTDETVPPSTDSIRNATRVSHHHKHAGGLQAAGSLVAVAVDDVLSARGPKGKVVFFDVSDAVPKRLGYEITRTDKAGATGLTRLRDGRYLLVVGGFDSNRSLDFYISKGKDPADLDFVRYDQWSTRTDQLRTEIGDNTWPSDGLGGLLQGYQSLNLVNQCDGSMFMVATHRSHGVGGQDWADLYRIDAEDGQVTLTKVAKKHLYCNWTASGRACDLAAAAGAYVDPDGDLLLYATAHAANGAGGTIRMAEFRHRDVHTTRTCGAGQAWVELYDDDHYRDRSIVVDFVDRKREDLHNLHRHDGFNDKTSSVRWCAPVGCTIRLYEHTSFDGKALPLMGVGRAMSIPNLDSRSFGDKTSSVRFHGSCD